MRWSRVAQKLGWCVAALLVGLIRVYQRLLSPILAAAFRSGCRFYPSCSEYARLAITRYGVRRGVVMAARRLGRCHPFHPGGFDPPELRS